MGKGTGSLEGRCFTSSACGGFRKRHNEITARESGQCFHINNNVLIGLCDVPENYMSCVGFHELIFDLTDSICEIQMFQK